MVLNGSSTIDQNAYLMLHGGTIELGVFVDPGGCCAAKSGALVSRETFEFFGEREGLSHSRDSRIAFLLALEFDFCSAADFIT